MKILAIICAKFVILLGKIVKRGSSMPGKIALKIDKNLLKKFKTPSTVIAVTGSSGSCTGNAATATKLATARTISLAGDATGSASFDGSVNTSIAVTINKLSSSDISTIVANSLGVSI